MPTKNYFIVDFGASNGRTSVGKFDGSRFDIEVTHRFENRPVSVSGTMYWDVLRLFSEMKIGLGKSYGKYKDLRSIGLDTWGVDFGLIDKNGKLLSNPISYRDEQRNSFADKFFKRISREEIFFLTGQIPLSYYSLVALFMMKELGFSEYINANKFLMLPDLFNYFLTGRLTNEYTDITTSLLYDQLNGTLSEKLIGEVGLAREAFPETVVPGDKIGDLKENIADDLGMDRIPVIAPATHDTASAVAGIPVVDKNINYAFISMGTWGIVIKETPKPVVNRQAMEIGFANEAGVISNQLFKNIAALWLIQQCRDRWVKDAGEDITWDEIVDQAKTKKPLQTLIDVDDDVFMLSYSDMPKVVRDYCRENGEKVPQDIGEVSRVIYEGIALKARYNIEALKDLTGSRIQKIHMMGGGTKNRLLCQMVSDACGIQVDTGPTETTTVGNLLMQLKADGEIKDLDEGRQISLNSSKIESYEPQNTSMWDGAYKIYYDKYKTVNKY